MSEPTLLYLSFNGAIQTADADHQLSSAIEALADPRIVEANHVAYDVEPYFIVNGLPVADTSLGIDCSGGAEIGLLSALGAYPYPYTVDLGANSRWLPLDGTFDDGQDWAPFQGSEPIRLDADSSSPTLDSSYEYLLGKQFATGVAMTMDGGDYFLTDQLNWGATSVTVVLVAVLHTPQLDSYGLLETYPADGVDPNRPYVGLRYTRDGEVQVHVQGLQTTRQTSSGQLRTGQPIVVALQIVAPSVVNVAVVDRSLTHWTTSLVGPHPYDARMYVGRAPGGELGAAVMDILEVGYWTDLDVPGMLALVNRLDALYGVSR